MGSTQWKRQAKLQLVFILTVLLITSFATHGTALAKPYNCSLDLIDGPFGAHESQFEVSSPRDSLGNLSYHIGTLPQLESMAKGRYFKLTLQSQLIQFEVLSDKSSIALSQAALSLENIPNRFNLRLREGQTMYLLKCETTERARHFRYLFR